MNKIRNKKRLGALTLALLLVFLVGGAFALLDGTLDITGSVNIAAPPQLYVIWSDVEGDYMIPWTVTPAFTAGATQRARIVDARGRTNQRIEWSVYFSGDDMFLGAGVVTLTATAQNVGLIPALIDDFDITFNAVGGFTLADFGLDFQSIGADSIANFVSSTPLAPGASRDVQISILWDGTIPTGFAATTSTGYQLAATLVIEFDYIPAP